jgi:hypothetical protein
MRGWIPLPLKRCDPKAGKAHPFTAAIKILSAGEWDAMAP